MALMPRRHVTIAAIRKSFIQADSSEARDGVECLACCVRHRF
jgi:hypothetical protein